MSSFPAPPVSRIATKSSRPLSKDAIADLSPREISRLTQTDLVRVVQSVQLPFMRDSKLEHLQYLDRPTLERLVYLARRTCRNQGY